MIKEWIYAQTDKEKIQEIVEEFNVSELLSTILVNRKIEKEQIKTFLNPTRDDFYNPFLLQDIDIAVQRIIQAIDKKQKVIIYGDYDVDGITSITVLKSFLEDRGLNVDYYIPNRLDEGYGLNRTALDTIISKKYELIITVDCGISSYDDIKYAKDFIDIIVTDHHEPLEILPEALAVINPKRNDSTYPFRGLAGVGVVYKLIQAISIKLELEKKEYLKFLDIVAIGTISDIVPLIDENRTIAKLGLRLAERTKNQGLKSLLNAIGFKNINSTTISFGVAPRINACGRMGYEQEGAKLFLTKNIAEAEEITLKLNKYNDERQKKEKDIFNQAIEQIEKDKLNENNAIVLAKENWHHGVIGIVASKITELYHKPSILLCIEGDECKDSGRSIQGFDLHDALCKNSKHLEKYGGHEKAVGLTLKLNNLKEFKNDFLKLAENSNIDEIKPIINIDKLITIKQLTINIVNELSNLEPYGEANRVPVFAIKNLKIDSIRTLSEGKHIKLTLKEDGNIIDVIGFNLGHLVDEYQIGDKVDIAGNLEINTFSGMQNIQVLLRDMKKSL